MFVLTQARAERRRLFVIFYGNTETAERSSRKVETLCSTPLTYSVRITSLSVPAKELIV